MADRYDVLVIGGGPSGAAAQQGRRVLASRRSGSCETCVADAPGGASPPGGACPRRLPALRRSGRSHTASLLRARGPDHPGLPPYGHGSAGELDEMVVGQAVKAGATPRPAPRRPSRLSRAASVTGAIVHRKESGTGAGAGKKSRRDWRELPVGPLGARRDRSYPSGAVRGTSRAWVPRRPRDREPPTSDREGNHPPGYGWVFPWSAAP
jgi:hypothetical protein